MIFVNLFEAFRCEIHVDPGALVERFTNALSDEGLPGNLNGQHVVGRFQYLVWSHQIQLGRDEFHGCVQRLFQALPDFMTLVIVSQVFGKLLRGQAVLFDQCAEVRLVES